MRLLAVLAVVVLAVVGYSYIWGDTQQVPTVEATAVDPGDVYDPVSAGDPLPPGFRQLLGRDAILPVYAPEFIEASASTWGDDILVIGVDLGGEAKAYPVSFLNRREMVIDRFGDIPILVTW